MKIIILFKGQTFVLIEFFYIFFFGFYSSLFSHCCLFPVKGRGGAKIRELEESSGARIKVM